MIDRTQEKCKFQNFLYHSFASEIKLQRKLNDSGIVRLSDLAEIGVESGVIGVEELRVVKRVEKLRPKFDALALRDTEGSTHAQIEVIKSRPTHDISA